MSDLRLFGYPARLVVVVDDVELDVTHAIALDTQRVDVEAVLVAIQHHRQGTPPPLPDPNPARCLELTPEAQRQADRLRGGWPAWLGGSTPR